MPGISDRMTRLETTLERVEKFLDRHEKMVLGNGTPGCIVRIDRLEKTAEVNAFNIVKIFKTIGGIKKTIWLAMGGGITLTTFFSHTPVWAALIKLIEGK